MNLETFENELYNLLLQHLDEKYNIDKYLELLEVEPHNSLLMYVLSHAYFKTGNEEKAKEYYNKAVKENSNIDFDENYENIFVVIYYIFCTITTQYNPFCDDEIEEELKQCKGIYDFIKIGKKYRDLKDLSNANRIADIILEKFPEAPEGYLLKTVFLYTRRRNIGWRYVYKTFNPHQKNKQAYIAKKPFDLSINSGHLYTFTASFTGLGDDLYFARWIKKLKKEKPNIKITSYYRKNLSKLFQDNGINNINTIPTNTNDFDYVCSSEDLANLFSYEEDTPFNEGYLEANKELSAEFKEKYFNTTKKKVGIIWRCSEENNSRNIDLAQFEELFKLPDYQFYSLQLQTSLYDQVIMAKNMVVSFGEKIDDFSTTAALMDNMDVIVGCDTSVTNLSGAMGKKTLLILPHIADLRWGVFEQQAPCFNSVEMFRQKKDQDDYSECINRIKQRLVAGDF